MFTAIMSHRLKALELYRALYRYSRKLEFTDKAFYLRRVRQEFVKYRTLEDEAQKKQQLEVCNSSLSKVLCLCLPY